MKHPFIPKSLSYQAFLNKYYKNLFQLVYTEFENKARYNAKRKQWFLLDQHSFSFWIPKYKYHFYDMINDFICNKEEGIIFLCASAFDSYKLARKIEKDLIKVFPSFNETSTLIIANTLIFDTQNIKSEKKTAAELKALNIVKYTPVEILNINTELLQGDIFEILDSVKSSTIYK
jgi:hypothetical protein